MNTLTQVKTTPPARPEPADIGDLLNVTEVC